MRKSGFRRERTPVSTVSGSWAEAMPVTRVVGRFVITLFRSGVSAGRKLITCFYDVNNFAKIIFDQIGDEHRYARRSPIFFRTIGIAKSLAQ